MTKPIRIAPIHVTESALCDDCVSHVVGVAAGAINGCDFKYMGHALMIIVSPSGQMYMSNNTDNPDESIVYLERAIEELKKYKAKRTAKQ